MAYLNAVSRDRANLLLFNTPRRRAVGSGREIRLLSLVVNRIGTFAATLLFLTTSTQATPANKKAFEKHFGPLLVESQKSCAVCHVREEAHGAESLEDFPHNEFGKTIAALDGKISERLNTVFKSGPYLDNILLGRRPTENGPSDEALLAKNQKRYDAHRNRYPWKPFEKVQRPAPPEVANSNWPRSDLDRLIAAEHERLGLTPRPETDPQTWLRRVTIDLTGLAPTPEEIRTFTADPNYEKKVDELLASPRYGERWGRHFMDVWRYADWTGYKDDLRESARHIWSWRDWIIESLNEDKAYDRMILEMFAGDELWPGDENTLRATGYLARNFHRDRNQWMDDVVSHTSQAFLGITMGCSKCHDHMYDPFPQTDYYSMRAIFEPYQVRTDRVPGELDIMKAGLPRAYDASLTAKTYLFDRGDERFPNKEQAIPPAIPAALGGNFAIKEIPLPEVAAKPWNRDFVRKERIDERTEAVATAKKELTDLPKDADAEKRKELELHLAAMKAKCDALEAEYAVAGEKPSSDEWKAEATSVFEAQRKAAKLEAEWKSLAAQNKIAKLESDLAAAKKEKDTGKISTMSKALSKAKTDLTTAKKDLTAAEKKMTEKVTTKFEPTEKTYPDKSTGRRTAFAKWLGSKENPLTARVAANHIWKRHFEHGLVPTMNEFGANGREPSHPALLDWLAAEFMTHDWSIKALHKEIVLSATYRMESTPDSGNLEKDPDNIYLWRMPTRRMEGEIVRDNLLWVAGRLDTAMGGPDIPNDEAQSSTRRSIYLRHAHEKLVEFVQIFDGPKVSECYAREESIQPHQALALHNSPLTVAAAEKLAEDFSQKENDQAAIDQAFLQLIGRHPREEEAQLCLDFLGESETNRDWQRLMNVLLNHHEFVTVR